MGRVTAEVPSLRHFSKPRDFVVSFIPDGGLLGVGSGQPIFAVSPTPKRVETVHEDFSGFSVLQAAISLCHLVPGVGFVFALSNFVFESVAIVDEAWTDSIHSNLQWWLGARNILTGVSLATPSSDH